MPQTYTVANLVNQDVVQCTIGSIGTITAVLVKIIGGVNLHVTIRSRLPSRAREKIECESATVPINSSPKDSDIWPHAQNATRS